MVDVAVIINQSFIPEESTLSLSVSNGYQQTIIIDIREIATLATLLGKPVGSTNKPEDFSALVGRACYIARYRNGLYNLLSLLPAQNAGC